MLPLLAQAETAVKLVDEVAGKDMRWWFLGLLVVVGMALGVVARYFTARHDKMAERLDKVQDGQIDFFKTANAQLVNVLADAVTAMKEFSNAVGAVKHLFGAKTPS